MTQWNGQPASRLGRSIVTQVATAQTNATQFTTPFAAQTYQIRICHSFTGGIWCTIGSTAVVTANSAATFLLGSWPEYFACTSGQVLNFISTSTSTGYVCVTEMTWWLATTCGARCAASCPRKVDGLGLS